MSLFFNFDAQQQSSTSTIPGGLRAGTVQIRASFGRRPCETSVRTVRRVQHQNNVPHERCPTPQCLWSCAVQCSRGREKKQVVTDAILAAARASKPAQVHLVRHAIFETVMRSTFFCRFGSQCSFGCSQCSVLGGPLWAEGKRTTSRRKHPALVVASDTIGHDGDVEDGVTSVRKDMRFGVIRAKTPRRRPEDRATSQSADIQRRAETDNVGGAKKNHHRRRRRRHHHHHHHHHHGSRLLLHGCLGEWWRFGSAERGLPASSWSLQRRSR